MSYSELFQTLRDHSDEEAIHAIVTLENGLRKYEIDFAADTLDFCLNTDFTTDEMKLTDVPHWLSKLEESVKRNFTPHPNQENAYKKDLLRWFEYMRMFLELGRLDGARDIMTFFPKMFNPKGKQICGSVRSRCVMAGKNDPEIKCTHKFAAGEYICPNCDSPRSLCRKSAQSNGRCGKSGLIKGHGGDNPKGALSPTFIDGRDSLVRGKIFADQLISQPELQRMYIEALADPDYISLQPEIALGAARRAELLSQLDALDPQQIESEVTGHVSAMRGAVDDKKMLTVFYHADQIETLLTRGKDNRERWREISNIANQMARLADTERKRLVEAKKAVSINKMVRLQQETIRAVRNAVISGSEVVYNEIMLAKEKGILDNLNPDHIKRTMLRHLSKQLDPEEAPEIIEGEVK